MITLLLLLTPLRDSAHAYSIKVTNAQLQPLTEVMVNISKSNAKKPDTSDDGYPRPKITFPADPDFTYFTNEKGEVNVGDFFEKVKIRLRKPNFQDAVIEIDPSVKKVSSILKEEKDPAKLADAKPANVWLGALSLQSREDKIHFQMQCGFCHQQGSLFTRVERSTEGWEEVIKRMVRYGSRLPTRLQKSLPGQLHSGYQKLREDPSLLSEGTPWSKSLNEVKITQWAIGDAMSQTHDVLLGANHNVYIADNIQDRLYEVDTKSNEITVFKIPHKEGDRPGGLLAGRLKDFPKHDSTSNAHSLALSNKDGHIFITPSAQRRIIEFNPGDKSFVTHEIGGGFYPHTIRVDQQDRVWFTLALSNQIGKLDRSTGKFTLYDLPTRSFREKLTIKFMGGIFKLIGWGIPLTNLLPVDEISTGTPMPYGIDVAPDGKIWFARLHTKEIGYVDPVTEKVTMIPTPFVGPRRLRADAEGNIWIVSFGESLLAKYDPKAAQFKVYDLPVVPRGSETPYSLGVNEKTHQIWVNGNQSNAVYIFDVKSETWDSIPLPKRITFTRDFDFDEEGAAYTSNSNFPSWQIEDQQPTLIRIKRK